MCSNCSESCSIIWWSGSIRETPKLVFQGLLSAGGGVEHMYSSVMVAEAERGQV
jgi:hypothetical protein